MNQTELEHRARGWHACTVGMAYPPNPPTVGEHWVCWRCGNAPWLDYEGRTEVSP